MTRLKTFVFIALLFAFAPAVLAQADCPTIVQNALAAVEDACSATSRNQVCYGNIQLQATPREGVTDFQFKQAGDIADVTNIQRLELSTFSAANDTWGVALMKLQANLPDTLPGQNVTFLLFGDVGIENAVTAAPESTNTPTGASTASPNPTSAAQLGPMQAFYFKTGSSDRPCAQAPDSGLLVQSPQGAGRVSFTADGVDVTLGSTVYLQAADNFMIVSVVEGAATLIASGTTQIVPAGTFSRVPLGADGLASGAPEAPQPYNAAALQTLPLKLSVWETVDIAPALPADQITAIIEALQSPKSGTWTMTFSASSGSGGACHINAITVSVTLTFNDNDTLSMRTAPGATIFMSRTGDKTYAWESADGTQSYTFTFTSPTTFTGQSVSTGNGCNRTESLSGTAS